MGVVFNDIHTHMIDDFLFSNPTAQLGGWQGIYIRSTFLLIDVSKLRINCATREDFPTFFLLCSCVTLGSDIKGTARALRAIKLKCALTHPRKVL